MNEEIARKILEEYPDPQADTLWIERDRDGDLVLRDMVVREDIHDDTPTLFRGRIREWVDNLNECQVYDEERRQGDLEELKELAEESRRR
jgi:hypothetical protein